MEKNRTPGRRLSRACPKARFHPPNEEATLSGVYIETDDRTGKATRIVARGVKAASCSKAPINAMLRGMTDPYPK